MKSKAASLLGFASKARKLSFGMDMAVSAIKSKKAKLSLISFEISEKSQKEIRFFSDKNGVRVLKLDDFSIEDISSATGKRCGILTVNDKQFAEALEKEITEEESLNDK